MLCLSWCWLHGLLLFLQAWSCHNGYIPLMLVVTNGGVPWLWDTSCLQALSRNTELWPQKIRAATNIASSCVEVLTCLIVLPNLSHSLLEPYKHLNNFMGAEEKDQMANMFPRSWDITLFMMLWSILASPCNGTTGLCETRALSHNLWCAPPCQESCCKNQHFTYFLLGGGVRKQTFAVK